MYTYIQDRINKFTVTSIIIFHEIKLAFLKEQQSQTRLKHTQIGH